MSTQTQNTEAPKQDAKREDFGNGRFSAFGKELYGDLKRIFGLSPENAERIAKQAMSDVGRLAFEGKVKFGKINTSGQFATVKDVATAKKVTATYAMTITAAVAQINALSKLGFVVADCELKPAQGFSDLAKFIGEFANP